MINRIVLGCIAASLSLSFSFSAVADNGLITIQSHHSVANTADKFIEVAESKGLKVFARINHSANAAKNGMTLRPTELVLFGNPKIGTPLMNCAQSVAIDLPQKMLITEDAKGDVWLSYNDPSYLKSRHSIEGCDKVLSKVSGALKNLSTAAAK